MRTWLIRILKVIKQGIDHIITVPLITAFGKNSAKTGYLTVAIIYGCIFAACYFFCFAKTKEIVQMPEKEKISLKVQLKAVIQNRPYLLALVGQILFGFTLYEEMWIYCAILHMSRVMRLITQPIPCASLSRRL